MTRPLSLRYAESVANIVNVSTAHLLVPAPAAGFRVRVFGWGHVASAVAPGAGTAYAQLATQANARRGAARYDMVNGSLERWIEGGLTFPAIEEVRIVDFSSTAGPHAAARWVWYTVERVS